LILTEYLPETLRPELINFRRRRIGYTALHLAVYHRKSNIESDIEKHDNEPDNPEWHEKQPSQPKKKEFPIARGPQEAKKTSTVKRETRKPKDTTKYEKHEETDDDGWTKVKKKANVSDLIEKLVSFIE
jgi:hypothetical protein